MSQFLSRHWGGVQNHPRRSAKEKVRQVALYVDFIGKNKAWWSPREITAAVVEQTTDEVVPALYRLYREREMGLFLVAALQIYREEFATFAPDIEVDTHGQARGT